LGAEMMQRGNPLGFPHCVDVASKIFKNFIY
jgi:hypothetical protein